ncbi:MAG: hypothetical protein IPF78_11485 [Flavobacteriales bacterium]|nr:hypothetical protein [Flavobacteriales bacterium]
MPNSPGRKPTNEFRMTAQTMYGLEPVLAEELLRLGAKEVEKHNRAVAFTGDLGFLYKANLCLRTALRVLIDRRLPCAERAGHLCRHQRSRGKCSWAWKTPSRSPPS